MLGTHRRSCCVVTARPMSRIWPQLHSSSFKQWPRLELDAVATTVVRRTDIPRVPTEGFADVKGRPNSFDTIEHSEKLASMLQYVVAQADLKDANGKLHDMSPDVKATLDIIKEYLDMKQQHILHLSQKSQNEINDAVAKVAACYEGMTSVDTKRDAHATCRGVQGQLNDVETAKCDVYDEKRALPAPQCSLSRRTSLDCWRSSVQQRGFGRLSVACQSVPQMLERH